METKVAILRGINVGGKRKILMNDLRSLFEKSNFTNVKTYIQSGNIIFKSAEVNNSALENKIEKMIFNEYGFDVPVIVRTKNELNILSKKNPFYKSNDDLGKLHLTLLKTYPLEEIKSQFETLDFTPDKYLISDKEIFIYCEDKYHKSKLSNNFVENKLKVVATTRNWKTILKLIELC